MYFWCHEIQNEDCIGPVHFYAGSKTDVSWGIPEGGFLFAPDAAYKDGTYYLYFPTIAEGWKWRVGVASSEKPEGEWNGETTYYSIKASSQEGSSIHPEGFVYIAERDSIEFIIEGNINLKPDSLLVDGVYNAPGVNYIFRDVLEEHNIKARFLECEGTLLNPFHQVNKGGLINSASASTIEGDEFILEHIRNSDAGPVAACRSLQSSLEWRK